MPTRFILVHFEISLRCWLIALLLCSDSEVHILVVCWAGSFESPSEVYVWQFYCLFFIVEAICNSSLVQFPLFGNENDRLVCDWLIRKDLKRCWSNCFIDLAFAWINWRKYHEASVIIAGLQVQIQTWHLAWRKETCCTVCTPFWSGFRVRCEKFGESDPVWMSSGEIAKLREKRLLDSSCLLMFSWPCVWV